MHKTLCRQNVEVFFDVKADGAWSCTGVLKSYDFSILAMWRQVLKEVLFYVVCVLFYIFFVLFYVFLCCSMYLCVVICICVLLYVFLYCSIYFFVLFYIFFVLFYVFFVLFYVFFVLFYVFSVLCRSLYCLCVYVYCTTATGWLPNCS
jgi:hypothetical protein